MKRPLAWLLMVVLGSVGIEVAFRVPSATVLARPQTAGKESVEELIRQLGNDRFEVREAAARALMDRTDAAPALRKAMNSPDREVSRRSAQILGFLDIREDRQALERLRNLAKQGEVDQMVQYVVSRGEGGDKEARWQCITEIAEKLAGLAKRELGRPIFFDGLPLAIQRPGFFATEMYPRAIVARHPVIRAKGSYMLQGEEVDVDADSAFNLIISSGRVCTERLASSVIFSGGAVDVDSGVSCIVICDGEFTARQTMSHSLIISRGPVDCRRGFFDCLVISGKQVHVPESPLAQVRRSKIVENESTPLGFVKFFEARRAGIEVEATDGEVRIRRLQKKTALARAGLRTGDVLIAINGARVGDSEGFRRTLRKLLMENVENVFRVRRANEVLEFSVVFDR